MQKHKDITSLETIPAAMILERETCLDLLPLSSSSVFTLYLSQTSQSQKKIHTRLNHCGTAWMNEWQSDFSQGKIRQKISQGTLLSFDWKTVLVFHSVAVRRWRRASTNHLHFPQISLPLPNPVSPHRTEIQVGGGGGNCWPLHLLSGEKRRDFRSCLSPSVSFITLVVISWSWDFFLLSAHWKVDKRPLCLLTPFLFPFNEKFQASRRLRRRLITKREFLLLSYAGVFISQDTISCSIAHHHAGIFFFIFSSFFLHLKAAVLCQSSLLKN